METRVIDFKDIEIENVVTLITDGAASISGIVIEKSHKLYNYEPTHTIKIMIVKDKTLEMPECHVQKVYLVHKSYKDVC